MRNVFGVSGIASGVVLLSVLSLVWGLATAEEVSYESAVAAFQAGGYEKAARQYTGLIEQNPGWAPGVLALGQCYYLLGRPEDGGDRVEQAHDLDPGIDLFPAFYSVGQTLIRDRKYEWSIAPMERALEHADAQQRISVVPLLGHAYLMTKRFAEARRVLESGPPLNNPSRHSLAIACQRTGDYDCALSTLRSLSKRFKLTPPRVEEDLAKWSHYWALSDENADRRQELLDQAVTDTLPWFRSSREDEAMQLHADVRMAAGQFDELIDAVLPRVRENADDCFARLVLARAQNNRRSSADAEAWARETIACQSWSAEGRLELAVAIMGQLREDFSTTEEVEADLLRARDATNAVADALRLDPANVRATALAGDLREARKRLQAVLDALAENDEGYLEELKQQREKETLERCRNILWKLNDESKALPAEDREFYDKNDCKKYATR